MPVKVIFQYYLVRSSYIPCEKSGWRLVGRRRGFLCPWLNCTVKVYEDALNYDNNTDKFNLSQSFTFNIMKGLTFKTTGTWFYFDDSREFFKGDYIVATG